MSQSYNVQCQNGHVQQLHHSSPLIVKALARERQGYIDALTVPCSECDECKEELAKINRDWGDELATQDFENRDRGTEDAVDCHLLDLEAEAERNDCGNETHGEEY